MHVFVWHLCILQRNSGNHEWHPSCKTCCENFPKKTFWHFTTVLSEDFGFSCQILERFLFKIYVEVSVFAFNLISQNSVLYTRGDSEHRTVDLQLGDDVTVWHLETAWYGSAHSPASSSMSLLHKRADVFHRVFRKKR